MHIKQIIIQGFKSYRDQLQVEPFSEHHNVVVGRNGSGKSNFFSAIRFVLGDSHRSMRPEERRKLLHEGAGQHVASAYVEVIFDNADGRIPVETDEVVIRRTIGLQKDSYFLNRKHIDKSEIDNILESAGFSSSNPYYIVQQGKVERIATMSDKDRLELLKEVAGTRVYEEKRAESAKILNDTQLKRQEIERVIDYIEERLADLSAEKKELLECQELDKRRRALEYTMYDKELNKAKDRIEKSDADREALREGSADLEARQQDLKQQLTAATDAHQTLLARLRVMQTEQETGSAALPELVKRKQRLELQLHRCQEEAAAKQSTHRAHAQELEELQALLGSRQQALNAQLKPEHEAAQVKLATLRRELDEVEAQREALESKRSRGAQYRNKKERNAYLRTEISELEAALEAKKTAVDAVSASIIRLADAERGAASESAAANTELDTSTGEQQKHRQMLDGLFKEMASANAELAEAKRAADRSIDERARAQEQIRREQQALSSTMNRTTRLGLEEIDRLVTQEGWTGIHGPLIDLFKPKKEEFMIAAEVVANTQLFNVVVDDDRVAARCIEHLQRTKKGRVTFVPLSRIQTSRPKYPKSADCLPLVDRLRYNPQHEKAILQVFGKTLVCRDLSVASRFAEEYNLNCVTMRGEQINKRGAVQGGYHASSNSKLKAHKALNDSRQRVAELEEAAEAAGTAVKQREEAVTRLRSEVASIQAKQRLLNSAIKEASDVIQRAKQRTDECRRHLSSKQQEKSDLEAATQRLQVQLQALETELQAPFTSGLTEADERREEELQARIEDMRKAILGQQRATDALWSRRSAEEAELGRMQSRITELRSVMAMQWGGDENTPSGAALQGADSGPDGDNSIETVEAELMLVTQELSAIERRTDANSDEILQASQQLEEAQGNLERAQAALHRHQEAQEHHGQELQRLLAKRRQALRDREDNMKKIRELGTLPADMDQYADLNTRELLAQVKAVNERLKRFPNVNRKAIDQFNNFSEQKAQLLGRKSEIDQGSDAIRGLIEELDQKKDEAIMTTFRGVAKHFKNVFHELVPKGSGKIVMLRKNQGGGRAADDDSGSDAESDNEGPAAVAPPSSESGVPQMLSEKSVESFKGVAVSVTFTERDASRAIQALSGGQKSLVALAFIFAIQRCDPAPFYLFDEIDQALDATHRAAVAALIKRQAVASDHPAQFITSTFRPEMVQAADKCYGVSHLHKISRIRALGAEEALEFIRDTLEAEEAVAGAAGGEGEQGGTEWSQPVTPRMQRGAGTGRARRGKVAAPASEASSAVSDA